MTIEASKAAFETPYLSGTQSSTYQIVTTQYIKGTHKIATFSRQVPVNDAER